MAAAGLPPRNIESIVFARGKLVSHPLLQGPGLSHPHIFRRDDADDPIMINDRQGANLIPIEQGCGMFKRF